MKRVLVAGATGDLGGFVVRELKGRGHFVRALARSRDKLDRERPADEIAQAEVTRPETIDIVDAHEAFVDALGRPARATHVLERLIWLAVRLLRLFNPLGGMA